MFLYCKKCEKELYLLIRDVNGMQKVISAYENNQTLYNHAVISSPMETNLGFHVHDICELIFLKKGNISGMIGDKIYKIKKNNLMIFRANTPHKIIFEDNADYERYDILFDENVLGNKVFDRLSKKLCCIDCNGNNHIIDLFKKMDFYCQSLTGDDLGLLITNAIEELLFNLYISPPDDFEGELLSIHPTVKEAVKYINEHYCEQISIDDICRELCVNKSHLHHLFSEFMQITPKKYINIRRLAKAQKLIISGEKPSAIFSSCGFCDYATFFRNYTSYFGYTPSQENQIIASRKIEL